MNNNPIGVFDSGIGGLSCVPALGKKMPNEQIIYYGDTANAPYGTRAADEIRTLAMAVADKLVAKGCKALSIACNTISCVARDDIQKKYPDIPVIGIVLPAAEYVAKNYNGKRVGLIATQATVASNAYPDAIKKYGGEIIFSAKATPDFVPLIEAGKSETQEMRECVKRNLDGFAENLDAIILGCTHYPFIRKQIEILYPHLEIIDPAQTLAEKTKEVLADNGLLSGSRQKANEYIASMQSETFDSVVKAIENL